MGGVSGKDRPGWRLVELPQIPDHRGNLTFVEGTHHIPFEIARIYYLYDVPGGALRDGNALRQSEQFIIAVAGSFDIHLDDGLIQETVSLRRPHNGLYLKPMVWRAMDNFSSGSVCLVAASRPYDASDYCRNYAEFLRLSKQSLS